MKSVHTPEDQKKFRCDTCGKGFINKKRFSEQLNSHTGEKPFKCTECIKSFVTKELLNRHIQAAHTPDDQKKFRCDSTCGKGFINKQRISEHLNIHTGEKPFICKFCPAAFANSGRQLKHEKIHLDRVRKDCPNCNKSFASQDSLGCHLRKSCKTKK